jgi:hypothetical protein
MKNLDQPANATYELNGDGVLEYSALGFTKRERACIDLRIPESGDAELDVLIEKARRQDFAAKALQGLLARHGDDDYSHDQLARYSVERAYALIDQLGRANG